MTEIIYTKKHIWKTMKFALSQEPITSLGVELPWCLHKKKTEQNEESLKTFL